MPVPSLPFCAMGFFNHFRINQAIGTIAASPVSSTDRASAIQRLREFGWRAVPKLVEALPRDPADTFGQLLSELVTNATLPAVVEYGLLSENVEVASRAKRALLCAKQIDPNRVMELYVGKGGAVINIADFLTSRKDAINAKSMLRLLEFAREDNQNAVFALIDRLANSSMVSALIGFLKNAEWEGRFHIARTIARFPSETVRDALVRLLADPNKAVREAALDGIAGLGMPVPIGPVCALLRDPDLLVQSKAIEALVKLNDPDSVRHLLEILQDESEHVRRAAVEVLNAVGNANAIKDLIFALKDKDWWVRVRAADALGAIGGPNVIDAVLLIFDDDDEFMRRTAVEILNTTKDERAFQHLVKALADPDWWVRERAIDALANIGNKQVVPHLISLLAEDNQTTPVAIRALAQLADARAVAPILAKLKTAEDIIQREAVEALGTLATPPQYQAVLQSLREFIPLSEDIRENAKRVAAELAAKHTRSAATRGPVGKNTPHANDSAQESASIHFEQTLDYTMDIAAPAASDGKTEPINPDLRGAVAPASSPGSGLAQVIDFAAIEPGQILGGRYKVVKELGRGGFGTVLQVTDRMVGEDIALKLINPQLVQDESTLARFMHEVRYARKITHENVIRVHDFLMLGSYYAISMEYFASYPLARCIRSGLHHRPARGLKLLRDIARGIHVAHQANIMHRDLKPANLLVNDDDILKIVDFGLAVASSHSDSRVTKTGHLIGTPTYMSPEQARGLVVDHRTDIYSLGVVMYEVFTGAAPYAGDNAMAVLYQHIEGNKQPPRSRNPALPSEIEVIILKAMALRPDDRYQSASDLLAALEALEVKEVA
ncbi:MAG: HEAT repeat domain-containing protein [Burkholderiales bacterium]